MWGFFVLKPQIFWRQKVPLPQRFSLFFYIDLVDVTLKYENFYYCCCWTTKHQCHRKDNAIKVYIQLVLLFKEANCIARFQSNMTGLTTCCFEDNIKVLWQLLQYKINSLFDTIIKLRCTVKTIRVVQPGLPFFLVIFTRRLVRGFPTYETLLEIM